VIQECLEIAVQAPTGGNIARYHFLIVTNQEKRTRLAEIYQRAYYELWSPGAAANSNVRPRDKESFDYLAEHLHAVPVHVIPCVQRQRVRGGRDSAGGELFSIIPATWSLMLALRARGIGSALTTIHTNYEEEAAELLGIPPDVRQAGLLPVAYYTGADFKPAFRAPVGERSYWDTWGKVE
jgi:nitroreductase